MVERANSEHFELIWCNQECLKLAKSACTRLKNDYFEKNFKITTEIRS